MHLFDTIAEQIESVRLPLFAITLTAARRADTPVLLMLHWHGFLHQAPPADDAPCPVPGSALQINQRWHEIKHLDEAMLEAAWRLGAWELDREERRSCLTVGASDREALECQQAFGENLVHDANAQHLVAEAPDLADLYSLGAEVGYVRWQFRPVQGGVWRVTATDDTLSPEGTRDPPCPVRARAPVGSRVGKTRYRLGKIHGIIVP